MKALKFLSPLLLSSCFSCAALPKDVQNLPKQKVEMQGADCETLLETGEKFIYEYYMDASKDFEGVRTYKYEMLDSFCSGGVGVFILQLYLEMAVPEEYAEELKKKTGKEFMYGVFLIELRAVPDQESNEIVLDYGSIKPLELGVVE